MRKKVACLNEGEIQALIDNELSGSQLEKTRRHIDSCYDCKKMYVEMDAWSDTLRNAIKTGDPGVHNIPVFTGDVKGSKLVPLKNTPLKKIYRIMPRIAALFILGLLTWLIARDNLEGAYEPTAYDLMLWEENMAGNDANRLWHMQNQPLMIIEPDYE